MLRLRPWLLASVLLLVGGCTDGDVSGKPIPTPTVSRAAIPSSTPVPSPRSTLSPATASCPADYRQPVLLSGSDLGARVNLYGVLACSDGVSKMWLKNGALVPWVIDSPTTVRPSRSMRPDVLLFREVASGRGITGVLIEPGETVTFPGSPASLRMHLEAGPSWAWQTLASAKTIADGKVKDGFATRVAGVSGPRKAFVECGRSAWDATALVRSADQKSAQTPALFALDSLGLGQQAGSCGTALAELQRREPQHLVTATELATDIRRPAVSGVLNDTATATLRRLCAASPRGC